MQYICSVTTDQSNQQSEQSRKKLVNGYDEHDCNKPDNETVFMPSTLEIDETMEGSDKRCKRHEKLAHYITKVIKLIRA